MQNPPGSFVCTRWELVIRPTKSWLGFSLADLWRYRELTMLFVWRDFVAQYKQTVLGPLWHLLQPLFTTVIFTVLFGKVARLPTDRLPPSLFYLAGITAWSYFADGLSRISGTFIQNAPMFRKVYFPRMCVPLSIVLSGLIRFTLQFGLLLILLVVYWLRGASIHPNHAMLLTPLLLAIMAGLALGAGMIMAAMTTRYRDLQHVVALGMQLLMYATPVIYPLSLMKAGLFRWLVLMNPMTPIIETFRFAFLGAGTFIPEHLVYSALTTAITLFVGSLVFHHAEQSAMDEV